MNELDILNYIYNKLNLENNLSEGEINLFCLNISKNFLNNSNSGNTLGRTLETIEKHMSNLISVLKIIGFSEKEIIQIINNEPTLIGNEISSFLEKYFILNLVDTNAESKKQFVLKNTKDLRTSEATIIRRYLFLINTPYPKNYTYRLLITNSKSEFFDVFKISSKMFEESVTEKEKEKYFKTYPYKKYKLENKEEFNKNLNLIEYDQSFLDDIYKLESNNELLNFYYSTKRKGELRC